MENNFGTGYWWICTISLKLLGLNKLIGTRLKLANGVCSVTCAIAV